MTIVVNRRGVFTLSEKAEIRLRELGLSEELAKRFRYDRRLDRSHPLLVKVVEELGLEANGSYADLALVEVPDDTKWYVASWYGREVVKGSNRIWPEKF
ncbi:MAG: hypothetical protein ACYC1M_14890 [Armatimonadota bacterium]